MRAIALLLISVLLIPAGTTVFWDAGMVDGSSNRIAWQLSSTMFTGAYNWPWNRKPLTRYNGTSSLASNEPDFVAVTCNSAADTITVSLDNHYGRRLEQGALPDNTRIKFVGSKVATTTQPNGTTTQWDANTTSTPCGGIVPWETNQWKEYYVKGMTVGATTATLQIAETSGGAAVDITAASGTGTTGMAFAGYIHPILIRAVRALAFTCDVGTDICTTISPHERDVVANPYAQIQTSGTTPGGLELQMNMGQPYAWCLETINTTQFYFRRGVNTATTNAVPMNAPACTTTASNPRIDITSAGTGTHYLVTSQSTGNSAAEFGPVVIWTLTGLPAGTTVSWWIGDSIQPPDWTTTANGGNRNSRVNSTMMQVAMLKVPSVIASGAYPVVVTTSESATSATNTATYTIPMNTLSISATVPSGPSTFPAIPGHLIGSQSVLGTNECGTMSGTDTTCEKATWEYVMTSTDMGGGANNGYAPNGVSALGPTPRCPNRTDPVNPLGNNPVTGLPYTITVEGNFNEREVWYYSDETFWHIARWTGDINWTNCGKLIANEMVENGYPSLRNEIFPWTLVAAYGQVGDEDYLTYVEGTTTTATYWQGTLRDANTRELSYVLESYMAQRRISGEESYAIDQLASAGLGIMYAVGAQMPERMFSQVFMGGLMARALIRWYMISHDERVPYILKIWMDEAYANWYTSAQIANSIDSSLTSGFDYNPEPVGTRCSNPTTVGQCGEPAGSQINNLITPVWAWYWRLTGNDTYRTQGDDAFARVWREGHPFQAKEWSQNYYWSWDYVGWRTGKQPAY